MSKNKKPQFYMTDKGKVVSNSVLDKYTTKQEDSNEDSNQILLDNFNGVYGANKGIVQPIYNPIQLANILELNTYHARCVNTKARDVAGTGWELSTNDEEGEEPAIKEEIEEMLNNLSSTLSDTLDRLMTDYESVAYACLEVIREEKKHDAEVFDIKHIPATTMRIHKSGNKFLQKVGTKSIWFKKINYPYDIDKYTGEEKELGSISNERVATEIIWINNYNPRSAYYGIPDIIPALGAVVGDFNRKEFNISFFENFGIPAYAITISGDFDEGEKDEEGIPEIQKNIQAMFRQMANKPHSTMVLTLPSTSGENIDVNIEPLSTEVKEASFRLFRKDNRDEVITAHGVPAYRIGIIEKGNLGGNIASESTKIYNQSIIQPRQEIIESVINKEIIWAIYEAYDLAFELQSLDMQDDMNDLEIITRLFDKGAVTPNDLIRNFGDRFSITTHDHPAMDAHYIGGVPIDLDDEYMNEAIKVIQDFKNGVADEVIKYATRNPEENRGLLEAVEKFKG